jgi:hypothetical protein
MISLTCPPYALSQPPKWSAKVGPISIYMVDVRALER